MPSPDDKPNTLAQDIEEERLRVWREKRAAIADASRQERLKQAEADRRNRLDVFEADKARRIHEAAERRAQENAALKAERMATARSKIAGRTDIEAARNRLQAYRQKSARVLALKLSVFVIIPTLLVAAYLFTIATPLYSSHVQFALIPPATSQSETTRSAFETSQLSREAHVLREVIMSSQMQTALDTKADFGAHFSQANLDPISHFWLTSPLAEENVALKRYVKVSVNGQDGLIRIETRATTPKTAQLFAQTVLATATNWVETGLQDNQSTGTIRMVTPPTMPVNSDLLPRLNALVLFFLGFVALYAVLSIFSRTLQRHGSY